MKIKAVSGIMLTLLLIGMLILAFNIQQVKASGTIYIRADGSVEGTTHITSVDNVTYNFIGNINESIVVERDNIVVDGADYTLQGTGSGTGIYLSYRSNVTIKNMEIKAFHWGVYLSDSSNNTISGNNVKNNDIGIGLWESSNNAISGNNIANNGYGILLEISSNNSVSGNNITKNHRGVRLYGSSSNYNVISGNNITNNQNGVHMHYGSNHNTIFGNNITNNYNGIILTESSNNKIYHNNFIDNTNQTFVQDVYTNIWDNGYPSGGNYWSDYVAVANDTYSGPFQNETGSDGIGDTAYVVDANNTDHYPLMYPWGTPPPLSYTLTVYSSPTGVTFTVDGVSRTTPWSGTYIWYDSVSLVMPATHDGYVWNHWQEDGDTNRTKTVTMNTNITLTGVFTPAPPIATVDIDPDTLNLKSKGKWITCYIELQKGYDVSDIDRTTILLNDTIPVASFWVDKPLESVVGDYDDDGIPDLMFKFSRTEVSEYIHYVKGITYGDVTLTITGELYDGSLFEGSDVIRIKMPSEVNSDDDDEYVDIYDIAIPEFPSFLILPLFMIATLLAVIGYRRKHTM